MKADVSEAIAASLQGMAAMLQEQARALSATAEALARVNGAPAPERQDLELITVAEAAALSRRKPATIYEWSRGASWAVRPSPRTLLVNKAKFLAWLSRPRAAA